MNFNERLDLAINKSRNFLLSRQTEEGYWVDELESNATITAELVFFMHFTETVDLEKQKKITNYLLHTQREDCLWYTSDAADKLTAVDPGGRRSIRKKTKNPHK